MIALVAIAVSAVGWLSYRNLEQALLPRVLDRIETHSRLVATDLESHVGQRDRRHRGLSVRGGAHGLIRARQAGGIDPVDGISEKALARAAGVTLRWPTRCQAGLCDDSLHRPRRRWPRTCPRRSLGTERSGSDRAGSRTAAATAIAAISRTRSGWPPTKSTSRRSISIADNGVIETAAQCRRLRIATPVFDARRQAVRHCHRSMSTCGRRSTGSGRRCGRARTIYRRRQQGRLSRSPRPLARIRLAARQADRLAKRLPGFGAHRSARRKASRAIVPDQAGRPGGVALAPALLAGSEWVACHRDRPQRRLHGAGGERSETRSLLGRPDRGAVRGGAGGADRADR